MHLHAGQNFDLFFTAADWLGCAPEGDGPGFEILTAFASFATADRSAVDHPREPGRPPSVFRWSADFSPYMRNGVF